MDTESLGPPVLWTVFLRENPILWTHSGEIYGMMYPVTGTLERTGHMAKTHNNPFTKAQIEMLQTNKYVKSISASTIRFTEEFKLYFYQRHTSGTSSRQIFIECGIDPDILGESRVSGFCYMLNKHAKRDEGFSDARKHNFRRASDMNDLPLETQIKQLRNELAYTRQEVEFLKKLQMADMEARRQWESKHPQK